MDWEAVIGIEIHVELNTRSKMFCGCVVDFGAPPNTNVCPVCLGLPGALPVPNLAAIEKLVSIGLALNSDVSPRSVFHRKNYFYADLPKNYQISQFDLPVCRGGHLDVTVDGETRRIGIERAHMEEDTGKSTHLGDGGRIHLASSTLLDFNRSGVPLVEIVSKPDIRGAAEARAYAQEIRSIVAELNVSDARLEEGSLRFDANVSIRPVGSDYLGTKVEIKNMNSFRSLERAVESEIERQVVLMESAGSLTQETRHWDEEQGVTRAMRSKEGSSDYRYFTDPDLTPLVIDGDWIDQIRASLPELPADRRARYREMGLDERQSSVLADSHPGLRALFDEAVAHGAAPAQASNWVNGEVTGHLRRTTTAPEDLALAGAQLAELLAMVDEGVVSATAAKEVLEGVLSGEGDPGAVATARDLVQVSDRGQLERVVAAVVEANPDAVTSFRDRGEEKVVGFLVGQVMKETKGKADPRLVNELVRDALTG